MYKTGLNEGDRIISINGTLLGRENTWEEQLRRFKPGDSLELEIERFGSKKIKTVVLEESPTYRISIHGNASVEAKRSREAWLSRE